MITVIIGPSCSGKTTLAKRLHAESPLASLYFTDDFKGEGFEQSLYALMEALGRDTNPDKIIEGVQVPRLLRKGLENKSFHADRVIQCVADDDVRDQRYLARGDDKDIEKRKTFDKMVQGIFDEYITAETNKPELVIYRS